MPNALRIRLLILSMVGRVNACRIVNGPMFAHVPTFEWILYCLAPRNRSGACGGFSLSSRCEQSDR